MAKVPRTELAQVLVQKLQSKKTPKEIAAYLLETNRTNELDSLLRDIITLRAELGIVEVTAVSARELSPASTNEIKAEIKRVYPRASEIIVNERIDFNQIGGVRLEFPDRQLDLSVRGKLNQFKRLTTGN